VPAALASVRALFFGHAPDRALLNYRSQELLTCAHAGGLGAYVTGPDPRITYWPFGDTFLTATLKGVGQSQRAGTAGKRLYFYGDTRTSPPGVDRLYYKWVVTVIDADTVTVAEQTDVDTTLALHTNSYTVEGGLSSPVPLPGTAMTFRFDGGVGSVWDVTQVARPAVDLARLVGLLEAGLGARGSAALFGPDVDPPEPYRTFARLWDSCDEAPRRLAGAALALAYRLDALEQ
jgi:hypothetical protein